MKENSGYALFAALRSTRVEDQVGRTISSQLNSTFYVGRHCRIRRPTRLWSSRSRCKSYLAPCFHIPWSPMKQLDASTSLTGVLDRIWRVRDKITTPKSKDSRLRHTSPRACLTGSRRESKVSIASLEPVFDSTPQDSPCLLSLHAASSSRTIGQTNGRCFSRAPRFDFGPSRSYGLFCDLLRHNRIIWRHTELKN